MGPNGSGKSTLIRVLSKSLLRHPARCDGLKLVAARLGGVRGPAHSYDNVRFLTGIYNCFQGTYDYVKDFSNFGTAHTYACALL